MPKESNLELKVGIFVLLALACLTVFVFSISENTTFQPGQHFRIIFNFANGLRESAPVRMAGVDQGIVEKLEVFFDDADGAAKVRASVKVSRGLKVPVDSTVMINQLGLLGEKYIEIIPGKNKEQFLRENDIVIGKDPIAQEVLAERLVSVSQKIEKTIDGVNEVLLSEKNRKSLELTLENFSYMTEGLNNIIDTLESGQGTLGKLIYDPGIYDDLEGFTADVKANPWKLLYKPKK